jgi:hypothetical protein
MAQIDAASPAVLGINELLADESRHRPKARRDLAEMLGAGLEVDIRRQRYWTIVAVVSAYGPPPDDAAQLIGLQIDLKALKNPMDPASL